MTEINLAFVINEWLKTRHLRWQCSDGRLRKIVAPRNDEYDEFASSFAIEKDCVKISPTTCLSDPKEVVIPAAHPKFFEKLEAAIRHEDSWCCRANIVLMGIIAIEHVWSPAFRNTVGWTVDCIDDICSWLKYHKFLKD